MKSDAANNKKTESVCHYIATRFPLSTQAVSGLLKGNLRQIGFRKKNSEKGKLYLLLYL